MKNFIVRAITNQRTLFVCARVSFGLFVLLTSFYCLLSYIPLTRHSVIEWTLVSWLPAFVRFHALLYWIVFGLVAATLGPGLRRPETKRVTVGFIGASLLLGLFLSFRPFLSELPSDERSFFWSLIALFPLLWVAAIDHLSCRDAKWKATKTAQPAYLTAILSALFLSLVYAVIFYLRYVRTGIARFRSQEILVAISWSIASHLLVFTFVFVILKLIRAVSVKFNAPPKAEFLFCNLLVSILGTLLFRKVIFAAIAFNNYFADIFSVAVSVALTAYLSSLMLRLRQFKSENGPRTSYSILPSFMTGRGASWAARLLCLAGISFLAYVIPVTAASADWNSLLQQLSVVPVWVLTFVFFWRLAPVRRDYSVLVLIFLATASMGAYKALEFSRSSWPALFKDEKLDVDLVLERFAGYDVSFGVARKVLSPADSDPAANSDESAALYTVLQKNTNLPPSTHVAPVEIDLVDDLQPSAGVKPHVFIFVIDSLRRDYLSPYNEAVNFSPSIERFARESVVMENAFTRYGGTALSEPSIWTGTMQLHKQYIEPFYPMNALQKLLEAENYQSFITLDPVLAAIVRESPNITELDKGTDWLQYDFCRTLKELERKLDERTDDGRPVFVYTQPQNVHLIALKNSGYAASAEESYPGFDATHASQVRRMDDSFGRFIQYLKARGMYNNSLIVLTSDHGDSLGEEGRWGHGSAITPEVIRIPMIVHLPQSLKKEMVWDTKSIAFLTDLTPSLYYLLGHRPILKNEMFGRPLFTATEGEQKGYLRENYPVASSYGPVYGILHDNGSSLFIADAINGKEYLYDLTGDFAGQPQRLSPAVRTENETLIQAYIQALNRFYKFNQR